MKKLLALCISICSLFSFGQDYQSIKSNQVHYFLSYDEEYTIATRTDSIEIDGTDSVFYSFQSPRNLSLGDSCLIMLGDSWVGNKVVIEDDGSNLFFNKELDTIHLETQAVLNDTFLVYTYPTGEWVKGWISDIDTATYLGILDSVKVISLFSNHSGFDLISPEFAIGKTVGLVKVYPFYNFPEEYERIITLTPGGYNDLLSYELVGSDELSTGMVRPTRGEYFDHEVGDRYIYVSTGTTTSSSNYLKREREVVEKTIISADVIEYDFATKTISSYFDYDYPELNSSSYTVENQIITYDDLDGRINDYLPEEIFMVNSEGDYYSVNWNIMGINDCDRIEEQVHLLELVVPSEFDSNCYLAATLGLTSTYQTYVDGIGGKYFTNGFFYDGWGIEYGGSFAYYEDSEGSCGELQWVSVDDMEEADQLLIFPNPAREKIIVTTSLPSQMTYVIHDFSGKQVLISTDNEISISDLRPGIYILSAVDGQKVYQEKFIKQ